MEGTKSIQVYETEDKVRRWLNAMIGSFDGSPPGLARFVFDEWVVGITVAEIDDEDTIVESRTLLADSVPRSPELFERLARQSETLFGWLAIKDGNHDGVVDVWFHNRVLGTCLDLPEFEHLVYAVIFACEHVARPLVGEFGGILPADAFQEADNE